MDQIYSIELHVGLARILLAGSYSCTAVEATTVHAVTMCLVARSSTSTSTSTSRMSGDAGLRASSDLCIARDSHQPLSRSAAQPLPASAACSILLPAPTHQAAP